MINYDQDPEPEPDCAALAAEYRSFAKLAGQVITDRRHEVEAARREGGDDDPRIPSLEARIDQLTAARRTFHYAADELIKLEQIS